MTFAFRRSPLTLSIAALTMSLCSLAAHAQYHGADDPPWQEAAITPPSSFSTDQLQTFEVSQGAALSYGIDPKTLRVDEDGVVRYVLVARSSSGALNALYQGVRCQTAEVKTYGRWNNNASTWNTNTKEEWQPLLFSGASRPAMMLARAGICDGRTINGSPAKILQTIKQGRPEIR